MFTLPKEKEIRTLHHVYPPSIGDLVDMPLSTKVWKPPS